MDIAVVKKRTVLRMQVRRQMLIVAHMTALKFRKLNYARPAFESRPFPGREKLCDSGVRVCLASSDSADPKGDVTLRGGAVSYTHLTLPTIYSV